MNKKYLALILFFGLFIYLVYHRWFIGGDIIGGDWPYLFPEMVRNQSYIPSSWQSGYGGGMGGISPAYFLSIYKFLFTRIAVLTGIPWNVVYRFFWFFLPVLLLSSGGWLLLSVISPTSRVWSRALAAMIIVTNTYVLMVTGGGQMGVFFSVSLYPWVLIAFFRFLRATNNTSITSLSRLKETILLGVAFGIQVSLDPRFAYLSMISMGVMYWFENNALPLLWRRLRFGLLAGGISVLMNCYWILPLLILKENTLDTLGSAYTTVGALRFFSFADFSHAIAALHPNWPENIFGKTYFLQPEFLILPLVSFMSLLFVTRSNKEQHERRWVWSFAVLGLVGTFLSKGANAPFGNVYVWLFEHVPGFVMFRDPTKFYVLIMISYAVLIPSTLHFISVEVKKYVGKALWIIPGVFILYWIILIHPALVGSLGGTFAQRKVPDQYNDLKVFLQHEQGFYRTLWIPRQSRFTFTSSNQLSIEAGPLLGATDAATLSTAMHAEDIQEHIAQLGIRYIIVPYDPYGELFTYDRTYSQTKRAEVEEVLDRVLWLKKIRSHDIAVYETPKPKDRFWLPQGELKGWRRIADDRYEADIVIAEPTRLIMSESFHRGWQVNIDGIRAPATKEAFGIMSFPLSRAGRYTAIIEFAPRRWFEFSRWISLTTFGIVSVYVIWFYAKKEV